MERKDYLKANKIYALIGILKAVVFFICIYAIMFNFWYRRLWAHGWYLPVIAVIFNVVAIIMLLSVVVKFREYNSIPIDKDNKKKALSGGTDSTTFTGIHF